jgi:hypothetical protein
MIIAYTLLELGVNDRRIYLYDTYEGMAKPGEKDEDLNGVKANDKWNKHKINDEKSRWVFASLENVKHNMGSTGYPKGNIICVKGMVEKTIPKIMPEKICLLRLDTDLYESTKHELNHLYPLLSSKGVVIIDDYGYWKGARAAVDEYIKENRLPVLMNRLDVTGRVWIK